MIESNAVTKINRWGSYDREFSAHCPAFTPVKIRTFFYPAWKLYVDGATAPLRQGDDGLMQFDLGKGDHRVSLQYESTDDVKIGLATSFLALILFGFWSFKTFWLAAAASENKT
jgi:hypothetical protein